MTVYYRNSDESKAFTESFVLNSPNYSECAYIGRRPLTSLSFLSSIPYNQALDRNNLELVHQHIIFANSGDNIGWSHKGLFSEDVRNKKYSLEPTCFEGATMRRAISLIDIDGKFDDRRWYHLLRNNCQDFISRIQETFTKISKHP